MKNAGILNHHRLKPVGSQEAIEIAFFKRAPPAHSEVFFSVWKTEASNRKADSENNFHFDFLFRNTGKC